MEKEDLFELIDRHYRQKYIGYQKFCASSTRSYHDGEEIVQNAYADACEYWKTYTGPVSGPLALYYFDIWFNTILRRNISDKKRFNAARGLSVELKDDTFYKEDFTLERIALKEIDDIISTQKPRQKEILSRYLWKGHDPEEIASDMDIKLETVRSICKRFKGMMRDKETKNLRRRYRGQRLIT